MKTLRILLQVLFVVANVVAVVLLILAAYSDRVSPDRSLLFSYLGLAFPVLCAVNLFFIFYWLFLWKWRFVVIGLAAFLICWKPVKSYFPINGREKNVPTENVMKILTYNVMAFGYKNHTPSAPNSIISYIAQSDADIVCLQEYAESKDPKGLTRSKIVAALKMYPYRSILTTHSTRYQRFGIAVFSKYPIKKSTRIKYDSQYNASSLLEIQVKGKRLMVLNNHLESFKLTMEDRSRYSAFIKNLGADGLDDLRGEFQQKLGTAFCIRAKQAEAIAQKVKALKEDDYVLVCGDFNDTPVSYAHRTIQGDLIDSFAESGRGMGVTYNQNFFWFRIDHILHSGNMKSFNCTVDKVKYSDHYPLWSYMELL